MNIQKVLTGFLSCDQCFLLQARETTINFFAELSSIAHERLKAYYRLKALEILIFLEGIDLKNEKRVKAYNRSQVDLSLIHILVAYGEACPFLAPIYSYECVGSVQTVLGSFIIPSVLGKEIDGAGDFMEKVSFIKGNNHAKAALESAIWGLQAKAEKRPLWQVLGGTNPKVDVGVSIGMQPSTSALLKKIEGYLCLLYTSRCV